VRVMNETPFLTFAVTFASATGAPRASLTKPKYDGPSSWWSSSSPSMSPPASASAQSAREAASSAGRRIVTVNGSTREIPAKKIANDHHHRHRDGPRQARPQAAPDGFRKPGGDRGDDTRDDARGRQPAEPVHGGTVLGLLHAQPPLVDRGVVGKQCVVLIDA